VRLDALQPGRTVIYCYPDTGVPGRPLPPEWDALPGARGCTNEACAFRDHHAELAELGADVLGISGQRAGEQREAVRRLGLPFPLLSDEDGALRDALRLPTFTVDGSEYLSRLTLVVRDGRVEHVFYPVFPPDGHAEEVLAWLRTAGAHARPQASHRRFEPPAAEAEAAAPLRGLEEIEPEAFGASQRVHGALRRVDVYGDKPVVARESALTRARTWMRDSSRGGAEEEARIDAELDATPRVTRTNTIAIVSPKGGVGKTTCTFLLGDLIAARRRLRVLAVDANRDFGTLAVLAPDSLRVKRSLADLLMDLDRVDTASQLGAYVSPLPSGLHVLGAPERAELMAEMTPQLYGELLDFLSRFYDLILLDLGTGIIDPLAQFGIQRADQAVIVTTTEYVTADKVLGALGYMHDADQRSGTGPSKRLTVVLNRVGKGAEKEREAVESAFLALGVRRHVVMPHDERLRLMLDSATYDIDALARPVRVAVKQLGLAVAEKLV